MSELNQQIANAKEAEDLLLKHKLTEEAATLRDLIWDAIEELPLRPIGRTATIAAAILAIRFV